MSDRFDVRRWADHHLRAMHRLPVHRWLERGREQAGLSVSDLWIACVALGSNDSIDDLVAVLDGSETPSRRKYDVIAQCLNERLRELGDMRLVPYGEDIGL